MSEISTMDRQPLPCPDRTIAVRLNSARGFTLVEIMIAATISLILLAGVAQLFVGTKSGYRTQENLSMMQENARFALQLLDYSLRMADHWGGVEATVVTGPLSVTDDCDTNWATNGSTGGSGDPVGIMGYEGAGSSPLSLCIPNADYVKNTDIMVARYADAQTVYTSDASNTSYPLADGTYQEGDLIIDTAAGSTAGTIYKCNATSGLNDPCENSNYTAVASSIFLRSAISRRGEFMQSNATGGVTLPSDLPGDNTATYDYPFTVEGYFIRPCSDQSAGTAGVCDAADDNGKPIPTLAALILNGDTLVQQSLIEGVEQMQFAYGITDPTATDTSSVTQYLPAASVTDWDNVSSVRVSLVMRPVEIDPEFSATTTSYSLAGGYTYTVDQTATDWDKYYRKVFTKVIQIRNRVRD